MLGGVEIFFCAVQVRWVLVHSVIQFPVFKNPLLLAACSRYLKNFLDNISRRTKEQFLPNIDNLKVLITLNDLVAVEKDGEADGASAGSSDEDSEDHTNASSSSKKHSGHSMKTKRTQK